MLGIVKEVGQPVFLAVLLEVFGKFTSVVGLDVLSGERGYPDELAEKISTIGG